MDLEKHPQQPTAPAEPDVIRASDADRDRIADILREAMAEGRLTADEHAERVDSVYRAKTVGELEPLVRDLPTPGGTPRAVGASYAHSPESPTGPADNLVAIFSSSSRKGRWRVGGRTNAFSLFGSVEIDLTEALFGQRLTVINATSVFGSVEIRVPENICCAAAERESSAISKSSPWNPPIPKRPWSSSTDIRCSAPSRQSPSAASSLRICRTGCANTSATEWGVTA